MVQEQPEANPLTSEHRDALDTAIAAADATEEVINRAKMAGIDLGDLPEQIAAGRDQARAIKQAFFPGQ